MTEIHNVDDYQLLRRYVEHGSQEAFTELMRRHIDLVFSVSRREVNDPVLAEDVTQAVFLILASKAASIKSNVLISGWLFNTARFAARNALRKERRRLAGEKKAISEMDGSRSNSNSWHDIEPLLNDGLDHLSRSEREALLLRYYEGKSFKEIGRQSGISEDAARLRTSRALEQLKLYLKKQGVVVPTVLLATLMTERVVLAAPASCIPAVMTQIGAGTLVTGAKATVISKGVLKTMLLKKIAVPLVIASLATVPVATKLFAQQQDQREGQRLQVLLEEQKTRLAGDLVPELQEIMSKRKLAIARKLREQWGATWATEHKELLRRMLRSNPDDFQTLRDVLAVCPRLPDAKTTGFSSKDLHPSITTDLVNPAVITGSWELLRNVAANPRALAPGESVEKARERFKLMSEGDFAKFRDVKIISVTSGQSLESYDLWVSGRITHVPKNDSIATSWKLVDEGRKHTVEEMKVVGNWEWVPLPQAEVEPSYDFLTKQ